MSALDKTVPALVADDLGMNTLQVKPADYIAALGYASRTYPIASPLIRLYMTLDRASAKTARAIAYDMATKEARKQNQRLKVKELIWIADHALLYVIDKNCPECHGLKYQMIPGTRTLGTQCCRYCRGDGRRHLPQQHKKILAALVARIERIESTLGSILKTRL